MYSLSLNNLSQQCNKTRPKRQKKIRGPVNGNGKIIIGQNIGIIQAIVIIAGSGCIQQIFFKKSIEQIKDVEDDLNDRIKGVKNDLKDLKISVTTTAIIIKKNR